MAKAKFDIPTQTPATVTRPLYAGVGVTDRVVEVVRDGVTDVQKRASAAQKDVQKTVSGIDYQPQALREPGGHRVDADRGRPASSRASQSRGPGLPDPAPEAGRRQVATAESTYDDLVKRGETLVGRIRRQQSTTATTASAKTTTAKAKTTTHPGHQDGQDRQEGGHAKRPPRRPPRARRAAAPRRPPPRPRRPRATRLRPPPTRPQKVGD